MLSWVRRRLTGTSVAMTIALVIAMTGGAYAASKYVITSTKQIKPSVLKQLQGKAGAKGAQGPAGTGQPGLAGGTGQPGLAGASGKDGTNGKDGVPGESVTVKAVPTKVAACTEHGGAEFKVGSGTPAYACNGQTGFVEKLPAGKTLTGEWSVVGTATAAANAFATSVNFAFPLKTAPTAHFVKAGVTAPPGCGKGTAEKPEAEEGNLCVFAGAVINVSGELAIENFFTNEPGASKSGFSLLAVSAASGQVEAIGTWAVMAE
jgi:hypothetical protein